MALEVKLKTLTPLYTGGADGKCDRVHETGLLGSLRWWYEALVRGLGGVVKDPTQDERSGFDPDKYRKSSAAGERARLRDAGLCDASQVFGATGWRRRFRLAIQDNTTSDISSARRIQANRSYVDAGGRLQTPTWMFPDYPRSGDLTIRIASLAHDFPEEVIGGLLQFAADWAAVGAKAQLGFGVVELIGGRLDTQPLFDWLAAVAGNYRYPTLPSLRNIFLACIQSEDASDPRIFDLKYDLRQLFAGQQNEELRHLIMGTVKGRRMAAKVKMSRPYGNGLVRVWGWIPEEARAYHGLWNRNTVVEAIFQHLRTKYTLQIWREMNSPRDTVAPYASDAQAFLQSLLGLEEVDNVT